MACRDCEEKAAAAGLEERVTDLERNATSAAIMIAVIAACVYVLWSKAFREA